MVQNRIRYPAQLPGDPAQEQQAQLQFDRLQQVHPGHPPQGREGHELSWGQRHLLHGQHAHQGPETVRAGRAPLQAHGRAAGDHLHLAAQMMLLLILIIFKLSRLYEEGREGRLQGRQAAQAHRNQVVQADKSSKGGLGARVEPGQLQGQQN